MPPETPASTKCRPFALRLAAAALRVAEVRVAAVDDRCRRSRRASSRSRKTRFGDLARPGTIIQKARGASSCAFSSSSDCGGARLDFGSYVLHVVVRARAGARSCRSPCGRGRSFRAASVLLPTASDVLQVDSATRRPRSLQRRIVSRCLRADQAAEAERLAGDRRAPRRDRRRPAGRGRCSGRPCAAARSSGGSAARSRA